MGGRLNTPIFNFLKNTSGLIESFDAMTKTLAF